MATPTPWQLANAGQRIPTQPTLRVIFSVAGVPWPYSPHYTIVETHGTNAYPNGVYGVNTGSPGGNNGSGGSGSGGNGGSSGGGNGGSSGGGGGGSSGGGGSGSGNGGGTGVCNTGSEGGGAYACR